MRQTSFSSTRSKGPGGFALIGVLMVVSGLTWWLWPEGDASIAPSKLSARIEDAPAEGQDLEPQPAAPPKDPASNPEGKLPDDAAGRVDKTPPAVNVPDPQAPAPDDLVMARRKAAELRKGGDDDALRRHLGTLAIDPRIPRDERIALLAECDKLNERLVWSATPGPSFFSVTVEPGDSYWKIARRLWKAKKTTATSGLIQAINQVRPNRLRLGQRLKVPKDDISLLVDKSDFTLYVLMGGVYVRQYPVGIGKGGSTPEGDFVVKGKTRNPPWRDPKTGKRFSFGEEGHVIGSRWMGFVTPDGDGTGYGIHGTIEPDTIGKEASEGCVRLVNADVEALFELVAEGASVVVRQ